MSEVEVKPTVDQVDAVIALGMGIDPKGILSEDGRGIAAEAVEMARSLWLGGIVVKSIVGTGGHSWQQEAASAFPYSEGAAMTAYMKEYASAGHNLPPETRFLTERESTSTVGNLANARRLLNLHPNSKLVVVTRRGHASQARLATQLIFPNAQVGYAFTSDRQNLQDKIYQPIRLIATHAAMLGVKRGNVEAVMRRQHRLDAAVYALAQPLQWLKAHV